MLQGGSRAVQVICNLFMNSAMCQAIKTVLDWEAELQGAQWSNLGNYANNGVVVTMADHMGEGEGRERKERDMRERRDRREREEREYIDRRYRREREIGEI